MRVLGVMGAEVGVEEAEVLIRIFEDRRGEAMAFAWARRRRSIEYVGQSQARANANLASFTRSVTCHTSENYFLWEIDVPFRRDAWPRCIVPLVFLFVHHYVIYTKDQKWK